MGGDFTLDAVLVAGGRSSRFGEDKAFIDWKGQPLYVAQLRKLAALRPDRLWLSTNADQSFPEVLEGVTRLVDKTPGLGPVGGLKTVFERSAADFVLVLAVDLPLMTVDYLRGLSRTPKGVVPRRDGFSEPLAALYPRAAMLGLLEAAGGAGERRLRRIVDEAAGKGCIEFREISGAKARLFTNLNQPEDLAAVEEGRFDEALTLRRYRVDGGFEEANDRVAAEEPLEIRVNGHSVAVTMRTPGHDDELAAGFLYTEGLIEAAGDILEIAHCPDVDPEARGNALDVRLRKTPDLGALTRHVFTSSSCGVCGKATVEAVFQRHPPIENGLSISPGLLLSLPEKLRAAQETFDRTGGLHASAIFDDEGALLLLREDVGRHNALDKVIGRSLLDGRWLGNRILLVSGRISFELMQKALAARLPAVVGISAPSSLAVKLARDSGQTLVGFLRGKGFNLYTGEW
ncbi:MAG: formate dehydrogenase accessory sulfurtransferase FdhD [Verrucomicrobiales bacterium]